jgi:hypothetical protein
VQYFAWANLYVEPPTPSDPITAEQAHAMGTKGDAFYIAEHDRNGELQILKKTYRGQTVVIWSRSGSAKDPRQP